MRTLQLLLLLLLSTFSSYFCAAFSIFSMSASTSSPPVVVGGGRIGSALKDMGPAGTVLVGRSDLIPDGDGPIYVCTRNDDLDDVIARTSPQRRKDLVFLQNGILEPLLAKHGLEGNTQALIYFAVAKLGEKPIDGVTDLNPEGLTCATGKWASEFKSHLAGGDLKCHVMDPIKYKGRAYEKHIFICAFNLVGAKHSKTIGEVEAQHGPEVRGLMQELIEASAAFCDVHFEDGAVDRLCGYARSVAHYPTAIKEFEHRNGFYWKMSEKARSEGKSDPTPLHGDLLREIGAV